MADLDDAIESLGKMIGDKFTDKFEMGTVIRWLAAGRYSYAALKTPVGWSTTSRAGNPYVDRSLTFEGLTKILKRVEVTNIEVATDWKPIGEQVPVEPVPAFYNREALVDQLFQPNSDRPRFRDYPGEHPGYDPSADAGNHRTFAEANPGVEFEDDYPGHSGESI